MLIQAGYSITFRTQAVVPMLAQLSVHPSRNKDLQTSHRVDTDPALPLYNYEDSCGNICTRLTLPPGETTISTDFVIADSGQYDERAPEGPQWPLERLPSDTLIFLLGSRYCETDRLMEAAWNRFGHLASARERVEAIVAFTHGHIEFGYPFARADKTAWNGYQERQGVCRDFAHLAITLCRCMNIPARYCTGYLGDIGVPADDAPMDFSAWFEVFIGGEWYSYDARHGTPRVGRILMARGRDAADAALTTSFGPNELIGFVVHTLQVDEPA